jgi:hypothetical protein
MGIGDLFEGFRRWLDGEEALDEAGQPKPRSKWEDFMVAIAREVGAVMEREMFTPPGGPTYIPREYIVFLGPEDDADWQGEKREGLERGLHHVLSQHAQELVGAGGEFQTRTLAVELRVDANLGRGQFRVQPVWDKDSDRTTVMARKHGSAAASGAQAPAPPAASAPPSAGVPMAAPEEEEATIVRPRTRPEAAAKALFRVDVHREGPGLAAPPDRRDFFRPKITIGRGSKQVQVDLRLDGDLEISREHATIELQDGQFVVSCLGRNSIFVDAVEVLTGESAVAQAGQKVSVCSYVLTPQLP